MRYDDFIFLSHTKIHTISGTNLTTDKTVARLSTFNMKKCHDEQIQLISCILYKDFVSLQKNEGYDFRRYN